MSLLMRRELETILSNSKIDDRQFVNSLSRGLNVLQAFYPNCGPLGNQDLSKLTGLPKPTISRITYTLTRLGFLTFLSNIGKYELGLPILNISNTMISNMQIRKVSHQIMQDLANYADASIGLAEKYANQMIYINNCIGKTSHALSINVGTSVSIARTSLGCALLACLPDDERELILNQVKAETPANKWSAIYDLQQRSKEQYLKKGFCIVDGDWRNHISAVAVPLYIKEMRYYYAINCAGPAISLSEDRLMRDIGPRLITAKREIESQLSIGKLLPNERY